MIKGVIFDFDGTIVLSEESRFFSLNKVLSEFDVQISQEQWDEDYKKLSSKEVFALLLKKRDYVYEELYAKNVQFRQEYIQENGLRVLDGFLDFYEFLISNDIGVIISSGGRREHIEESFKWANLPQIEFLGREDYNELKPSPDCFKMALKKLDLKSEEVIVFDDSYNGLLAGKRAEMKFVGINTTSPKVLELNPLLCVKNYNELDFEEFLTY